YSRLQSPVRRRDRAVAVDSRRAHRRRGFPGAGLLDQPGLGLDDDRGIKGKTLAEAEDLLGSFKTMMTDKNAPELDEDELGELEALQGVKRYPVRVKCAILPWNVLREGLDAYEARAGQSAAASSGD